MRTGHKFSLRHTHTHTHTHTCGQCVPEQIHICSQMCAKNLVQDTQSHKTQANIDACPDMHRSIILTQPGKRALTIRHRHHSHVNLSAYMITCGHKSSVLLLMPKDEQEVTCTRVYTPLTQAHTLCAHTHIHTQTYYCPKVR